MRKRRFARRRKSAGPPLKGNRQTPTPPSSPEELRQQLGDTHHEVITVDATSIALEVIGRAITNTAMMGAFVGATGLLGMESVEEALRERFDGKAGVNIEAARRAREQLRRLPRREA